MRIKQNSGKKWNQNKSKYFSKTEQHMDANDGATTEQQVELLKKTLNLP